jgi:hypothetical protein
MANRTQVVSTDQRKLGIVELVTVCADRRAQNLHLFEVVGGWVATSPSGPEQRLFSSATHRHAWHAQLWEQRSPSIPVEPDTEPAIDELDRLAGPSDRRGRYRAALESEITRLATLEASIHRELDPSTARTIDLITTDVSELLELTSVT